MTILAQWVGQKKLPHSNLEEELLMGMTSIKKKSVFPPHPLFPLVFKNCITLSAQLCLSNTAASGSNKSLLICAQRTLYANSFC